eukprot:scaffold70397_cov36-Phaeocystis_antarctica.AAC.2
MEMPSPFGAAAVVAPPRPRCLCSAAPLCDARQLDDEAGLLSSAMEMPSPCWPRRNECCAAGHRAVWRGGGVAACDGVALVDRLCRRAPRGRHHPPNAPSGCAALCMALGGRLCHRVPCGRLTCLGASFPDSDARRVPALPPRGRQRPCRC